MTPPPPLSKNEAWCILPNTNKGYSLHLAGFLYIEVQKLFSSFRLRNLPAFSFFPLFLLQRNLDNELTDWLTEWSRVLSEKLRGPQLVKKFPAFYGNRRFITAFTTARHQPMFWARSIQFMPHPTSRRCILILSSHLCLGLSSGLLPSCFFTKHPTRQKQKVHFNMDSSIVNFYKKW